MATEAQERLLANAIALRGDIEGLIERIDAEANRRRVNPVWARWLARALMNDRNALNIALDRVLHTVAVRNYPDNTRMWDRLASAFESASFAMTFGHRLLMEELGEL